MADFSQFPEVGKDDPWAAFPAAPEATPAPAPEAVPKQAAQPGAAKAAFDDLPWYLKPVQAADDIVRLAADGATFGYADKLAGAMGSGGTEVERAKTAAASERAGGAGTVAEIGGAMAVPLSAAKNGVSLVGRFGSSAVKGIKGLAARAGLGGVEGAGYGAASAAGHDEDVGKGALIGAAAGAGGSAAIDTATGAASSIAGAVRNVMTPSVADAKATATAAYKAADQAGVVYTGNSVARVKNDLVKKLTDFGYDPVNQPGLEPVLKRLEELNGQNISMKGWDTLRKVAAHGFRPGNDSNNKAVSMALGAIDDAVMNPAGAEVLTGNAQAGADALKTARDWWSRASKAARVEGAAEKADLRAASTGVGGNVENATRQNMRGLLERERGHTPDEQAMLEAIVRGTPGQNALRWLGKASPEAGYVNAGVAGGAGAAIGSHFGPVGATVGMYALPTAGYVAKRVADKMTQRRVDDLVSLIMAGGQAPAPMAFQQAAVGMRNPAVSALIGGAAQGSENGR